MDDQRTDRTGGWVMLRTVCGVLWLFSLLVAVFFLILAPFEIKKTADAWAWQPTKVKITKSRIEYVPGDAGGHSLRIEVQEVGAPRQRGNARVRFGGISHNVSVFASRLASSLDADQAKYPVGTETIAYRNPVGGDYLLEQNSIMLLSMVWLASALWLLANWRLIRRQ